jgi:arylformamidase
MPVWPGDPQVVLERVSSIEEGANANVSKISMSVHTGTHMDAPVHFLQGGKSIDTLPLEILIGPAQVIRLPDSVETITAGILEKAGIREGVERLLIKTRNSTYWTNPDDDFKTDFLAVEADGAAYLVKRGVKLVGIDYLSIAPFKRSRPTHETLLKAGMVILEGADLSAVPAGFYQLICLPLKLGGCDGSPARAVLIAE